MELTKGKILWFDAMCGEGVVQDLDGNKYYVHYSSIQVPGLPAEHMHRRQETADRPYVERNLTANNAVEFLIYDNGYLKRVDKIWQRG